MWYCKLIADIKFYISYVVQLLVKAQQKDLDCMI